MLNDKISRLDYLLNTIPALLVGITEELFSQKSVSDKWSKKEILGHLIDSATINHHRFIRSQFENVPIISYNQDNWNKCGCYNKMEKNQLIEFWKVYNKQILMLIKLTPIEQLGRRCNTGGMESYTIEFLFTNYMQHLEYHLKQITNYD